MASPMTQRTGIERCSGRMRGKGDGEGCREGRWGEDRSGVGGKGGVVRVDHILEGVCISSGTTSQRSAGNASGRTSAAGPTKQHMHKLLETTQHDKGFEDEFAEAHSKRVME